MTKNISSNCPYNTAVLFGVLLLTLGLTGCSDSPSDEEPNEMVLQSTLNTKIKSLDPISIRDVASSQVAYQIFETLYQYHFLKRPYEIEPLLAEGMPQISDDNMTYTIKIKKGVLFQDDACFPEGKGRELKSWDFVYAIKRIANIKNLSENWAYLDNKISGLDEFREYTKSCKSEEKIDYSREVEGLQTPDDYTLVIKLTKPWPQLVISTLTNAATSPVAEEAAVFYGKNIISHPVGTGPFKLKKWQKGSYIELVRNPNFRGELYPSEGESSDAEAGYLDDAGKPMPFIDKIVWTFIEESQPAWFLFLQGKLDAKAIPKDNWDEAMTGAGELTPKMKQLNIHLETFIEPSTFWLGFNMEDPVLGKNKPLRRAISYVINREKFIELFFGGRGLVAHGFVAPLLDSYDPDIKRYGYAEYNPEKARELLKEAREINGGDIPELKITLPGTETFYRQMGQLLRRYLNDVGINVEVECMDWPTYQEKVNTKSVQIFSAGVTAGTPDAEDFLAMFYSKKKSPGPNQFNYSNPEYDKLYEKIEVMPASEERIRLYRKMELMVLDDCPAAFMNHRLAYVLRHDWYKNYKPHVFGYGLGKYRRIDMRKRAAYKELLKTVK
ncbi:MAG: ABC transporter substrate-binding protein [Phycisphaerae bacterium]|nr:ABC transporter substrate-binding protein [Phycisphaerae bacterium]